MLVESNHQTEVKVVFLRNLILAVVIGMSPSFALGQTDVPDKYALLVGVTNYAKPELNTGLKFPERDASELSQVLKNSGFEVDLLLGKHATREAVLSKLRNFSRRGKNQGVIFVALCGHGTEFANSKKSFFCPFDTEMKVARDKEGKALFNKDGSPMMGFVPESMVAIDDVLIAFGESLAANRILVADCCRDDPNRARGRSFGSSLAPDKLPLQTLMLLGCSSQERSLEHDDWGHGALTKCLLEQMELAQSSSRTMGNIAEEVIPAVIRLVESKNQGNDKQTPRLLSTGRVEIMLTKNPLTKRDLSSVAKFRALYNACLRSGLEAKEAAIAISADSEEQKKKKETLVSAYESALAALEVDDLPDLANKNDYIKWIARSTLVKKGREKDAHDLSGTTSLELLLRQGEIRLARERVNEWVKKGDISSSSWAPEFQLLRNYFRLAPLEELEQDAKLFLNTVDSSIPEDQKLVCRGEIYSEFMLAQAIRGDLAHAQETLELVLSLSSQGKIARDSAYHVADTELVATLLILDREKEAVKLIGDAKENYPGQLYASIALPLAQAGKSNQAKEWFSKAIKTATDFMPNSTTATAKASKKAYAISCVVNALTYAGEGDQAAQFLLSVSEDRNAIPGLTYRLRRLLPVMLENSTTFTPAMKQLLINWERSFESTDILDVKDANDFAESLVLANRPESVASISKLAERIKKIEDPQTRASKLFSLAEGIGRGICTLESPNPIKP